MAYIYNADIYCDSCGAEIVEDCEKSGQCDEGDSNEYPQWAGDGGGEADCPQHCGNCGEFLENPLTQYGYEYVREAIAAFHASGRGRREIVKLWANFYDIPFNKGN